MTNRQPHSETVVQIGHVTAAPVDEHVVANTALTMTEHPNDKFTVLIISDDNSLTSSLSRYLSVATGFRVNVALDLQAGLESALQASPQVIICSVDATSSHRIDAAEFARELANRPLMIAISRQSDLADVLFQSGFDRYYVEPVFFVELETAIRLHRLSLLVQAQN